MSLRISSVGLAVLSAACGGPVESVAPGNGGQQEVATGTPAGEPVERIACAVGKADYADVCAIERTATADGTIVTIRHPDGGFRRLSVSRDGQTIGAADGAQPVTVVARGDGVAEVAIADARYRLPLR